MRSNLVCGALCAVLLATGARADAARLDDVEALMRLAPNRSMGSADRVKTDDFVARAFAATGMEFGTITFPTAVFVPGRAELRLDDGRAFPLYPLAPNVVHPGNLPDGRWSGRLVDVGRGVPEDMRGAHAARWDAHVRDAGGLRNDVSPPARRGLKHAINGLATPQGGRGNIFFCHQWLQPLPPTISRVQYD